jgi:short-subunit dehydrogenase
MSRVSDKVVVITGASAGIGKEAAIRLGRKGATVIGAARDLERLEQVAEQVPGFEPVQCDVATEADRAKLIDGVLERHGRVDALVNNAGLGFEGLVEQMPAARVAYLYDVNVVGLIDLCQRVLPSMIERKSGNIVNVASMAGYVVTPPHTVYSSTKFAVVGFTQGLKREVWSQGVRVHLVNPGPIKTEWLPRSQGFEPAPGSSEVRFGGFPATWVAAAIERCLTRPVPRIAAVPRFLGLSRVANAPGLRQGMDLFYYLTIDRRRDGTPPLPR